MYHTNYNFNYIIEKARHELYNTVVGTAPSFLIKNLMSWFSWSFCFIHPWL